MNNHNQSTQYMLPLISEGSWRDQARDLLRVYVRLNPQSFLFEDFRAWAREQGLEEPQKYQSWGSLTTWAYKQGLILWTNQYADAASTKRTGHQMKVWIAA